ncbi:competence type IV pilus minor pilin ComGG [Caldibacillus thermoamylovorans]
MERQAGVIFPFIAVVAMLFSCAVANALLLYEVERQAAEAARQAAEAEELVQMAVVDVKEEIAAASLSTAGQEGEWPYPRGVVAYRWERKDKTSVRVVLSIRSTSGLQRAVTFTVVLPALDITEWREGSG